MDAPVIDPKAYQSMVAARARQAESQRAWYVAHRKEVAEKRRAYLQKPEVAARQLERKREAYAAKQALKAAATDKISARAYTVRELLAGIADAESRATAVTAELTAHFVPLSRSERAVELREGIKRASAEAEAFCKALISRLTRNSDVTATEVADFDAATVERLMDMVGCDARAAFTRAWRDVLHAFAEQLRRVTGPDAVLDGMHASVTTPLLARVGVPRIIDLDAALRQLAHWDAATTHGVTVAQYAALMSIRHIVYRHVFLKLDMYNADRAILADTVFRLALPEIVCTYSVAVTDAAWEVGRRRCVDASEHPAIRPFSL